MTGVLFFFTLITIIHNQGRMSQSFTSMDALTQREKQIKEDNEKVLKELRELDEYINKDIPIYPEPEGDPSY